MWRKLCLFSFLLVCVAYFSFVVTGQGPLQDPAVVGQWSSPSSWPNATQKVDATHLIVLPNEKVLAWTADLNSMGGYTTTQKVYLWDPATNISSTVDVSALNTDFFCAGHSFLPDGRVLVTGGLLLDPPSTCGPDHNEPCFPAGLKDVHLFDSATNTWTKIADEMTDGRWYPTNTSLGNGEVLVLGGENESSTQITKPKVWGTDRGWRDLIDLPPTSPLPTYPWMIQAPNGMVFNAGPNKETRYLDTSGNGNWIPVADSHFDFRGDYCAAFVMYDVGKILIVGGRGGDGVSTASAEVIDLNSSNPTWRDLGTMGQLNFPRQHHNATLLPDGKVLVTGGSKGKETGVNREETDTLVDAANQQWKFTQVDPSGPFYKIEPRHSIQGGSPKALDVEGGPGAIANGAKVQVYDYWGGANQQWKLVPTGDGYYNIVAKHSNKCLDVIGGPSATANGIKLQQFDCWGGDNQKWQLILSSSSPIDQNAFYAVIAKHSGKALDVEGGPGPNQKGPVQNTTKVQQWDYLGKSILAAEMWDPVMETWSVMASMKVQRLYHSTAVLLPDARVLVAGGGAPPTAPGDSIHKDAEIFSPPYLFNGARPTITSGPSSVDYGQTFFVATSNASSITKVSLIRLPSVTHSFNSEQRINFLAFTQTGGGLNVTAPLNGSVCPPGYYMLFILNNNGVPSIAEVVKVGVPPPPFNAQSTDFFKIVAKHSNKVLDVEGGPGAVQNGAKIQQYDYLGGANQQWKLVPTGGGFYNIVAKHSNKCLDVIGGPAATGSGIKLQQFDCWGGDNQEWGLFPLGNGYYRIIAKHSAKALDVEGGPGATGNTAKIQQWDYLNGDNQKWALSVVP